MSQCGGVGKKAELPFIPTSNSPLPRTTTAGPFDNNIPVANPIVNPANLTKPFPTTYAPPIKTTTPGSNETTTTKTPKTFDDG